MVKLRGKMARNFPCKIPLPVSQEMFDRLAAIQKATGFSRQALIRHYIQTAWAEGKTAPEFSTSLPSDKPHGMNENQVRTLVEQVVRALLNKPHGKK